MRRTDASSYSPIWDDFGLYFVEHNAPAPLGKGLAMPERLGDEEDVRWAMMRRYGRPIKKQGVGWSLLVLPDVRLRCGNLERKLSGATSLARVLHENLLDALGDGAMGYHQRQFAYCIALSIRSHCQPMDKISDATIIQEALGMVPKFVVESPSEMHILVCFARKDLDAMPQDPELGGGYFQRALASFVASWPGFGAQAHTNLFVGGVSVGLTVSSSICSVYRTLDETTLISFPLVDIVGVRFGGNIDLSPTRELNDTVDGEPITLTMSLKDRGDVVLECLSRDVGLNIAMSLLTHSRALLRRGRGRDRSAETAFWRFELEHPALPTAPLPPGMEESELWETSALSLCSVVLESADANRKVHSEFLSELETICMSTNRESVSSSEFVDVLCHLDVIPRGVKPREFLKMMDSETLVRYEEMVDLLCRETNK
jgi:hypothetical protein